jgi:hypothetical protein
MGLICVARRMPCHGPRLNRARIGPVTGNAGEGHRGGKIMSMPPTTASEIDNEEYFGIGPPSNIRKPETSEITEALDQLEPCKTLKATTNLAAHFPRPSGGGSS